MSERQAAPDGQGGGALDASSFVVPRAPAELGATRDLHVCPTCSSGLVYPTDWAPAARRRWAVDLRCPDCEWEGGGVYAQEIVDRFDEALDAGTEQLLEDLDLLARANMEDQVDRFIEALRSDLVLPEDF